METNPLRLRCYIEQQAECLWVAVCIDLCLAAQGESYKETRRRLNAQIDSYIDEARTVHSDYYDQLVPRLAPWRQRLKYYLIHLRLGGLFWHRKAREFVRGLEPSVVPHHA